MRPLGAVALLSLAVPILRAPNHMQRPRALETGPRPQWGAREPERYGAGFRLATEYDHSRRIAPSVDFEGRRNAGPLAMALPVAVWYPTAPAQSSRPVPSRREYAAVQVSRPNVVVEARVRDFEFLLDHARRYSFADTSRIAAIGVNFDGMAALAFQMKNMAARAVVSLDGWEGRENGTWRIHAGARTVARAPDR